MAAQCEFELKNVKISNIKPQHERQSRNEIFYPTLLDLKLKDLYMPTIFAYRLADDSREEYERFVDRLKSSLEKVLGPFFGFAGRWLPHDERGRQLVCNDEGVPVVECSVDRDLGSVVKASSEFRPVAGLNGYEVFGMDPLEFQQNMAPGGLAPVFVQVTRFKCGGVVLGVTFNHMHSDGASFFDFMVSWAEVARTNRVTIQPNFDRSSGKTFEDVLPQMLAESAAAQSVTSKSDSEGEVRDQPSIHSQGFDSESPWTTKLFEVNASALHAMKSAVPSSDRETGAYISSVDCIVGHVWKSLVRLSDSVIDKSKVSVQSTVEGRNKFYDPPLPNLCGNVFAGLVCWKVPQEELVEEPAYITAQRHRTKLRDTKREEWLTMQRLKEVTEARRGAVFSFSSWLQFPLYNMDFGVGGRPYFSPGPNLLFKVGDQFHNFGTCFIAPPIPGHSSSAATLFWTCQSQIQEELESSPYFMSFLLTPSQSQDDHNCRSRSEILSPQIIS